jgi:Fanconi anemia group J protein
MKKQYNDERHVKDSQVLSSSNWYSLQAFRALNQALGRCIRHRHDYGAIILLDERFEKTENANQLPKWIRANLQTVGVQECVRKLAHFFDQNTNLH